MHADRGVEIGVGHPHDGGGRRTGREPGDIDAFGVDRVVAHDLPRDARDQRGLALAALLVARAEPVPALRGIGGGGLGRIGDQAGVLLGEHVHPRAGGEVVGRLGAAVQHDDQGDRLPMIAAGDVELVVAAAGLVAVGGCQKLSAVRHDVGRVHRRALGQPAYAWLEVDPFDPIEEAAQRLGQVRLGRSRRRAGRPAAGAGAGRLPGGRRWLGIRQLDRVRRQVDDARAASGRRVRGLAGRAGRSVRHRPAAKRALQERGGFGEPPGAGQAGRLEHVGVQCVVHVRSFLGFVRQEVRRPRGS